MFSAFTFENFTIVFEISMGRIFYSFLKTWVPVPLFPFRFIKVRYTNGYKKW